MAGRSLSYVGEFDDFLGERVYVVFVDGESEYFSAGRLVKPGFEGVHGIDYYIQESEDPRDLLVPIDNNATVYRDSNRTEFIGMAIAESADKPV